MTRSTTIRLDPELLAQIDATIEANGEYKSRTAFLERAARDRLAREGMAGEDVPIDPAFLSIPLIPGSLFLVPFKLSPEDVLAGLESGGPLDYRHALAGLAGLCRVPVGEGRKLVVEPSMALVPVDIYAQVVARGGVARAKFMSCRALGSTEYLPAITGGIDAENYIFPPGSHERSGISPGLREAGDAIRTPNRVELDIEATGDLGARAWVRAWLVARAA